MVFERLWSMDYPGTICHSALDAESRVSCGNGNPEKTYWLPASAGMTTNDYTTKQSFRNSFN